MSDLLYRPSRAVILAEEQVVDAAIGAGIDHTVTVRVSRRPRLEANRAQLLVTITPALLEPFTDVACKRTYEWCRRAFQLPTGLPGLIFPYNGEAHEFLGATTKPAKPGSVFLIARCKDGSRLCCSAAFVKKHVMPITAQDPGPSGTFSIGLGTNETFFDTP